MKRFQTYAGLETWLKGITGNENATFRGLYGEAPLIAAPELVEFRYKGRLKSVAMALRGAKALGDLNREAVEIDARMAAEVTEILRRLVMGELK